VRCPHCGNDNPETHRFCGMCGASLLQGPGAAMAAPGNSERAPVNAGATPRPAAPAASVPRSVTPESASTIPIAVAPRPAAPQPEPIAPRSQQSVTEEQPVISGPSFLGLNQPASTSKRARLSIDPNSPPSSRNLDYLLDDEEPKSGGGWKIVLILIALALAVSFGYLRWKNQGLPFLNLSRKPVAQVPSTTTAAPAPDANSNASAPTSTANTAAGSATPEAPVPTAGAPNANSATATNSAANPAPTQPSPSKPLPAEPAASGSASPANAAPPNSSSNPAPAITPATPSGSAANASNATPQPSPTAPATATSQVQPGASTSPNTSNAPSADNEAEENTAAAPEAISKPPAAIKRVDTVAEAQKYLYGKGVPQNCDRGLRMLKPAANAGDPKAMIEMGALYSAGLCTPHDLPTSYRWFAMALRKDPNNQSVATDLQKLWGEMTQPERQLAIRLSQ
jgi:hypothetical protein